MSEPVPRAWRFYVDDMIRFAEKVLAYTEGMDQTAFVASALTYDATRATRRNPLAPDERDAQPAHPCLSWHR